MKENELAETILILCIENEITISKLIRAVTKVISEFNEKGTIRK